MAKLSLSKGKSGEGFTRIFGDEQMGRLFSKVQSSVIRSGFELETDLFNAIPDDRKTSLDKLSDIVVDVNTPSIQVVAKPFRPDPDDPDKSIEADFLIVDNDERRFWLVEVKEGHVFDTKKADGELASLKNITGWLAQEFPYRAHYYICSFNQEDKQEIVRGTKRRFTEDHVLTGRELCEKIGIDFDDFRLRRMVHQRENRLYFLQELLAIPTVRDEIIEILDSEADKPDGS